MTHMATYDFTLVIDGVPPEADVEGHLYEVGCDDAQVELKDGLMALSFKRFAFSLEAALGSALMDVINAGLGACVCGLDIRDEEG